MIQTFVQNQLVLGTVEYALFQQNGVVETCQINKLNGSIEVPCNKKLIRARFFKKSYESFNRKFPRSQHTMYNFVDHETHTLSTTYGNFVPGANIFNIVNRMVKGGSPKSRIATYKVCWSLADATSCFGSVLIRKLMTVSI